MPSVLLMNNAQDLPATRFVRGPESTSVSCFTHATAPRLVRYLVLAALICPTVPVFAEEGGEPGRLYRTREEQREAGLKRSITPWLTFSGLAEFEWVGAHFSADAGDDYVREGEATVQGGFVAKPLEPVEGELIVEFDTVTEKLKTEEATVSLELDPLALTVGKQYLPFGVFFSQFASGPLIELGETRATAADLSYDFDGRVDLSVSAYRGRAREQDNAEGDIDWVLAMESWPFDNISFGLSYITNLADADGRLLEEQDDRFLRKVPGLSGYALWVSEKFGVSFEALGATGSFAELEPDRDQPMAWNFEIAYFPYPRFDWALRVEGSRELEDAPSLQYGTAINIRLHRYATLTMEILHGRFKGDLATDDNDNRYSHVNRVAALLSVVF